MLTIGSLFAGIGGLELGLEWAGLGPTMWQVETDEFCRRVLAKHWPEADRSVTDVRQATAATLAPVDLICGGFPCQDLSAAGKGAGITGVRSGLWFEFHRIIWQMAPRWVVFENVGSAAIRWVDHVVEGLDQLGYTAVPFPLSAADVGAWHLRRRVFVVAYHRGAETPEARNPDGTRRHEREGCSKPPGRKTTERTTRRRPQSSLVRGIPRLPTELDFARAADIPPVNHERGRDDVKRRRALGNSVVPQCAEIIGWIIRELIGGSNETS